MSARGSLSPSKKSVSFDPSVTIEGHRSPAPYRIVRERDNRSASPERGDCEPNYRDRESLTPCRSSAVNYAESPSSSEDAFEPPSSYTHRSALEKDNSPGITANDDYIDNQEVSSSPTHNSSSSSLFVPEDDSDHESEQQFEEPDCTSLPNTLQAIYSPSITGKVQAIAMPKAVKPTTLPSKPLLITKKEPGGPRKRVEDDPENIEIMRLRTEEGMDWGSIVNHMNNQRIARGEAPTFTQPAVYSRFVRNSPRIAAAHGEMFFDPKDYMHLRHPHYYPNQREAGGIGMRKRAGNGSLLNQTLNRNANAVGSPFKEDGEQELEERERTQMLVDAVDKVQRNFWVTVADEMERATGKLYDAKVVEARYRAVQN